MQRQKSIEWVVAQCLAVAVIGGCGLLGQSNKINSRPAELVVWGDPASDTTSPEVAGQNLQRTAVGTDGHIIFSNRDVCNNCEVEPQTGELFIDGQLRGRIRWTNTVGDDGQPDTTDDGRMPFYVSAEGYLLDVDVASSGTTFRTTAVQIESPDDPSDDTAFQVGTVQNPDTGTATGGPLGQLLTALGGSSTQQP